MTETRTVLGEEQRGPTWTSTLTGVAYRWDDERGWIRYLDISQQWVAVKAGVVSHTVYARAGEHFTTG